jgi:hypothetical protein
LLCAKAGRNEYERPDVVAADLTGNCGRVRRDVHEVAGSHDSLLAADLDEALRKK